MTQIKEYFHTMFEIRTERLLIRPLAMSDLDQVYEYSGNKEHIKYMIFLPHESREEAGQFLEDAVKQWSFEKPAAYELGMVLGEKVIGSLTLYMEEGPDYEAELGWVIHPAYTNKGYVTEGAAALMEYAREKLHFTRITAHCDKRNDASARVMEKLGLTFEGEGEREYKDGTKAPELSYAIEW